MRLMTCICYFSLIPVDLFVWRDNDSFFNIWWSITQTTFSWLGKQFFILKADQPTDKWRHNEINIQSYWKKQITFAIWFLPLSVVTLNSSRIWCVTRFTFKLLKLSIWIVFLHMRINDIISSTWGSTLIFSWKWRWKTRKEKRDFYLIHHVHKILHMG